MIMGPLSHLTVVVNAKGHPFINYSHTYLLRNDNGPPFALTSTVTCERGPCIIYQYVYLRIVSGYPVSDNITLNCEGVAHSHIKGQGGETAMGYPFELTQCPLFKEIINC